MGHVLEESNGRHISGKMTSLDEGGREGGREDEVEEEEGPSLLVASWQGKGEVEEGGGGGREGGAWPGRGAIGRTVDRVGKSVVVVI